MNLFKLITEPDIKGIGMEVLTNGKDYDGKTQYIQICDKDGVIDKGDYTCHYEILYMGTDTPEYGNHKKYKIYLEIHFENETLSPFFQPIINDLLSKTKLESFYWRPYCPGLRIKDSVFTSKEKAKIIANLKELKKLTLNELLQCYNEILNINHSWESSFTLQSGKRCSKKRALSEYYREPKEIFVVHEDIKNELIKKIKENNALLDVNNPIDIASLSPENPVNGINYIDLAAKTIKGEIVFFEIKSSEDARLCIRQALGQLMEYAYFPYTNTVHAQKLVVVGTGEKTDEIIEYLKKLKTQFNIPIDYLQVKIN